LGGAPARGPDSARDCFERERMEAIFFYIFALLTLVGAVLTITRKSAVHSALWLIVSLLGVAGLYLQQRAEFLFAVQIVLYIGGIMVLFLFVIMLVNLDEAAKQKQFNKQWLLAVVCALLVGGEVWYFMRKGVIDLTHPAAAPTASALGNTERLADVLFSEFLVPFEVASLLLLIAIVGSVVMAKKRI
jgi:NADH-quinone oxidoreductase subunit J